MKFLYSILFAIFLWNQSIVAMEIPSSGQTLDMVLDQCRGTIGIYAINITNNKEYALNEDIAFPIGSLLHRVILAAYLLKNASLDEKYLEKIQESITKSCHLYGDAIRNIIHSSGQFQTISIEEIFECILKSSDSTLLTRLMNEYGNHAALDEWLKDCGFNGIHVDAPIQEWEQKHLWQAIRYKEGQEYALAKPCIAWHVKAASMLYRFLPEPTTRNFLDESINTAHPRQFTSFLLRCLEEESSLILNGEYAELMLKSMLDQSINSGIKKYLPTCTLFHAASEGILGMHNEAGVLESGTDCIIFSIFIKNSRESKQDLEDFIARLLIPLRNHLSYMPS